MFKNYFKTAFRNQLNNKIYSFIKIAGLNITLACAMLIMLYVQDEVSHDRFHKNVNQIYRIDRQISKGDGSVHDGSYTGYFSGPCFAAKKRRKYKVSFASNQLKLHYSWPVAVWAGGSIRNIVCVAYNKFSIN